MSNTFLSISEGLTLKQLSSYVGSDNVNNVLNVNGLKRQRDVYGQVESRNESIASLSDNVSWSRKAEILNLLSTDSDVFEHAAMQDEDGWKVLSNTMSFADALSLPSSVDVVKYDDVLGNGVPVTATVYKAIMQGLEYNGTIDRSVFNSFSTIKPVVSRNYGDAKSSTNSLFAAFNVPWGDVTFYSSLSDDSIDIPVYPQSFKDGRVSTYSEMPSMLYQYEPWYSYSSSGPRTLTLEFHMHRQMWTGDERDGKANELIRFVEASAYAKYNGSCVNSDTCTLYIKGYPFVTGIVTSVSVNWDGPIGLDGFYLEFTLSISFTEVSTQALSYDVVKSMDLIG